MGGRVDRVRDVDFVGNVDAFGRFPGECLNRGVRLFMCGKIHATCQLFDVVQAYFQQAIDKGLIQTSIRVPRTARQLDGRRQIREHVDFPRGPLEGDEQKT